MQKVGRTAQVTGFVVGSIRDKMKNIKEAMQDGLIINGMRIRNRLALPPLTTNYGGPEGTVTNGTLQFYRQRAKDVGLVIVEATAVRADGRIVSNSLGLWDDSQIGGMKNLADSIKDQGAAAVVQISHAGARGISGSGEMLGASPSGVYLRADVDPFIMSQTQIDRIADDFGHAARRAAEAGFDGVEIHGAHFYLISQFLSPVTNLRKDRYGGGVSERATFALEIMRSVREKVGLHYPVLFRINAVEKVQGGQTAEDALAIGRILSHAGVDALDVSIARCSWQESNGRRFLSCSSALSKEDPFGANVALAARFREATNLPVIAIGKLWNEAVAAEAIHNSKIDMVAIGRQMIADPDAAGKILAGKSGDIVPCKECLKCFGSIGHGVPMACSVNKALP